MAYDGYECLKVGLQEGVARVTIDHPPINLFDLALMGEMDRVGREIEADPAVRVVVFDSADPEFFIAHADVDLMLQLPDDVPAKADTLGFFHVMVDRFRTMPKVSIGQVEGRARGGGVNRALPPGELAPFVDRLARRIASFPPEAIALAKQGINAAEPPVTEGLLEEAHLFNRLLATDDAKAAMKAFMEAGGQTRELELVLGELDWGKAGKG